MFTCFGATFNDCKAMKNYNRDECGLANAFDSTSINNCKFKVKCTQVKKIMSKKRLFIDIAKSLWYFAPYESDVELYLGVKRLSCIQQNWF